MPCLGTAPSGVDARLTSALSARFAGSQGHGQTRWNLGWLAALPDPGEHLQFAVVADSHQQVDELAKIVDAISGRPGIDFVAHLGDMTDVGLREEYQATLEVLKRLRVPFVTAAQTQHTCPGPTSGHSPRIGTHGTKDAAPQPGGSEMKPFQDKRSVWWLLGVGAALVALFVAFVVVPSSSPTPGAGGVEVDVPKMENVPPPAAARMKLESQKEE
jgi:hypothetical protein